MPSPFADSPEFLPPRWMRPAMVQTLLASLKFRKRGHSAMEEAAIEMILNCGPDESGKAVRLKASYSPAPKAKALMIFLHGWEGSQESTYVVACARRLFEKNVSTFRINFRDHGQTHSLNEDIFLATRFREIQSAVRQAIELSGSIKAYVVGFSLGGNFALRLARAQITEPLALSHIFAISPVIDPWEAAPIVDQNPFIQRYFQKKLRTTYTVKQAHFPEIHDFTDAISRRTIMEASSDILLKHSGHETLEQYFSAYGIKARDLETCPTPVTLIMADDDPVVPAAHLDHLHVSEAVNLIRLKYGGHNGFFQSLSGPTWYEDYIDRTLFPRE